MYMYALIFFNYEFFIIIIIVDISFKNDYAHETLYRGLMIIKISSNFI